MVFPFLLNKWQWLDRRNTSIQYALNSLFIVLGIHGTFATSLLWGLKNQYNIAIGLSIINLALIYINQKR
jgi:hypothetical protein